MARASQEDRRAGFSSCHTHDSVKLGGRGFCTPPTPAFFSIRRMGGVRGSRAIRLLSSPGRMFPGLCPDGTQGSVVALLLLIKPQEACRGKLTLAGCVG